MGRRLIHEPIRKNQEPSRKKPGVVSRVVIVLLILLFTSILVASYETRTIEPQADWNILVDSYDWEIDYWDDIEFYNATEGWIVGRGDVGTEIEDRSTGIVMHTSNGGVDWELMFSHKMDTWSSNIQIVTADTIWIPTSIGLLHTEDRGLNWEYIPDTMDSDAVQFRNSTYGLASINRGMKFTNDSGNSWYNLDTWNFQESLYEINFVGDDVIWACGYSGIYKSSDGGSSWYRQRNLVALAMAALNDSEAWALGWGLGITHCTDGATWSEDMIVSGWRDTYDSYRDMEFVDENNGWLVGNGFNSLAYTPDGGANWYSQPLTRDLRTIDFVNETHGWVAGWRGVIARTTTGNQFGSKLIINGYEISVLGMGISKPRIPQSVIFIDSILLIALLMFFTVERVVFVNKGNNNEEMNRRGKVCIGSLLLFYVVGGISVGLLLSGYHSLIADFFIILPILSLIPICVFVCYLIYDYPNEQHREAQRQIKMESSVVLRYENIEPIDEGNSDWKIGTKDEQS